MLPSYNLVKGIPQELEGSVLGYLLKPNGELYSTVTFGIDQQEGVAIVYGLSKRTQRETDHITAHLNPQLYILTDYERNRFVTLDDIDEVDADQIQADVLSQKLPNKLVLDTLCKLYISYKTDYERQVIQKRELGLDARIIRQEYLEELGDCALSTLVTEQARRIIIAYEHEFSHTAELLEGELRTFAANTRFEEYTNQLINHILDRNADISGVAEYVKLIVAMHSQDFRAAQGYMKNVERL